MEYIIKDENGENLYRIYPYENELCWCIDRWSKVVPRDTTKEEFWTWKFTDRYPRTIVQAFQTTMEMMTLDKKNASEEIVENFRELKEIIKKNNDRIVDAIERGGE